MKIKYSPCKHDRDTLIEVVGTDSLRIDGVLYDFDVDSMQWPDIFDLTGGAILAAHREDSGELFVTVQRFYTGDCRAWDSGEYMDEELALWFKPLEEEEC